MVSADGKPEILSDDPVDGLDVSVLQNALLSPVLGIKDPKTDARIDFVGGIRGIGELENAAKQIVYWHFQCIRHQLHSFLPWQMQDG